MWREVIVYVRGLIGSAKANCLPGCVCVSQLAHHRSAALATIIDMRIDESICSAARKQYSFPELGHTVNVRSTYLHTYTHTQVAIV